MKSSGSDGVDGSRFKGVSSADLSDALRAVGSKVERRVDGGYLLEEEKKFLDDGVEDGGPYLGGVDAQRVGDRGAPCARVRFECGMLITKEDRADAKEGERKHRWRPLRCLSSNADDGDEDDYDAMLSRSWDFSDADYGDPVFVVRPRGDDEGPLGEDWWARSGKVWSRPSAESEGGAPTGVVTRAKQQQMRKPADLVITLGRVSKEWSCLRRVHLNRQDGQWEVIRQPHGSNKDTGDVRLSLIHI